MTDNHFADVSKKGDTIYRERDRIECAIRHIQTAVDVDPWAMEIAVEAMREKLSGEPCEDVISRQAAIDALAKHEKSKGHNYVMFANVVSECAEIIRDLPSAQPEIIRCKDCKYRDENWRRISVRWLPCMDMRTGSNWYCGSAERGEQDENR